jgi:hypothetical protein
MDPLGKPVSLNVTAYVDVAIGATVFKLSLPLIPCVTAVNPDVTSSTITSMLKIPPIFNPFIVNLYKLLVFKYLI